MAGGSLLKIFKSHCVTSSANILTSSANIVTSSANIATVVTSCYELCLTVTLAKTSGDQTCAHHVIT